MGRRGAVSATYLIDTVILVDHLNGVAGANEWLSSLSPGEAAISVVTCAEVLVGAGKDDREAVTLLLGNYSCLSLTSDIADVAADLRRKHRWKLLDAFQAAVAHVHHLKLVTRNSRDFPPQRFEFVLVPYRL